MKNGQIIAPLHGLRGLAALTVVFGHYLPGGAPALGVVLFFVLSGFLIGRLYLEAKFTPKNIWKYCVARFARVYPLFALVVIATVVLNSTTSSNVFRLGSDDVISHLALAGSAKTIWTISAEFQFYGLFILVWALGSYIKRPLMLLIPLVIMAITIALWLGEDAGRIQIFGYLHIFLLGTLIATLTSESRASLEPLAAKLLPVLAVGYLTAFLIIPVFYAPRWVYIDPAAVGICTLLVASTVIARDCFANRLMSLPICVWLGEISFGIYLLHRHAQWFVDSLLGGVSPYLSLFPKIALTLILAQAANLLIERPARSMIRNLGEKSAASLDRRAQDPT